MSGKGIDVSHHQGIINWDKVKADGIQFAMIRIGFGSNIKSQDDKQFERNVRECERVGIPWGAYLYSYALDVNQAKSEADHALRLLNGKNPQYPVAFDMEDADQYKAKHGIPSNNELVNICDTFLDIVEDAGHYVCLYANLHWLTTKLNSNRLDCYDKWVAQWGSECTYNQKYSLWQYTSSGQVNGIYGRVDMNYCYEDFTNNKHVVKPTRKTKSETINHHNYDKQRCVVTGDVWLHSKPNFDKSTRIRVLFKGEHYNVYGEKNGMYGLGAGQYASKDYIKIIEGLHSYTVKNGDSMWVIAQKHEINLNVLIEANPQIDNPNVIQPGQKINIP